MSCAIFVLFIVKLLVLFLRNKKRNDKNITIYNHKSLKFVLTEILRNNQILQITLYMVINIYNKIMVVQIFDLFH
jgi:hypothetical protein